MKFVAIAILALTLSTAVICPCAAGTPTDQCVTCAAINTDCATCKAGSGVSGTTPSINCVICTGDQVTASDSRQCVSQCATAEFKDTTAKICKVCSVMTDCIACSATDKCSKCNAGKYLQIDMKSCGTGCAAGQTKDDAAGTCKSFGALKFALGAIALLLALLF